MVSPTKARAELCERYFYEFFIEFWPVIETVELILSPHIKFICDELQAVYERWERGESQLDVLVNVPPGSSKSTIISQVWPAWLWVKNPKIRIISSSYAADLSTSHAVKSRDIVTSEKFESFYPGRIRLKADENGKTNYKNTKGGQRFVTSTNGTVTGMHGDFIITDDPLKPIKAGATSADMATAETFQEKTLSTRKTNKARSVQVMVMQRLHDRDPAGVWISKRALNHICLPAEESKMVKPERARALYVNGLLDPVRMPAHVLENEKNTLGAYGYAGQFSQNPTPEGGVIWQGHFFIPVADSIFPRPDQMMDYGTDWDTAFTADQMNDASAFAITGRIEERIYLDNFGYMRMEFPELVNAMKLYPAPHYIEAKASGKSAKQTLVKAGINAIEVDVVGGDKIARTRMQTPTAQAGRFYVRESILERLLNDEEQGLLRFPNGAHDDVNDAIVQALNRHSDPLLGVLVA